MAMTPNAHERRQRNRRRTLMGGTVRFAAHTGAMTCVVRNLCAGGARLEMEHTLWLPDRFDVDIPHQNLRVAAKVVWREKSALGIAFDAPAPVFLEDALPSRVIPFPARPPVTSRSDKDRLVFLEQERARLEMRVKQLTDEF